MNPFRSRPAAPRTTAAALAAALLLCAAPVLGAGSESEQEAALRSEVQQALARDAFVEQYEISVTAEGDAVTLRGGVRTDYEKQQAGEVAGRVPGVETVHNELLVGETGAPETLPPGVEPGAPLQ